MLAYGNRESKNIMHKHERGKIMNKAMTEKRDVLVNGTDIEKILEVSTVLTDKKLTEKQSVIATYVSDLITSKRIGLGYQFGIRRFNAMFVDWCNGKSYEKANVMPTVKDVAEACKSLYLSCKEYGFFPIVKTNTDGAIIIDCVKWVDGFYSQQTKKKESESKTKTVSIDYDQLIKFLKDADASLLLDLKNDLMAILKDRNIISVLKKSA